MSKIISLFNQSGGVGKSTLTMNLGYHLGREGHRVLLVDMDPQASLTAFMGLEPADLSETVYQSLLADAALPVHNNIHGVDLVPANIDLSGAELELVLADMRDIRLKQALQPITSSYDFVLIDCPPSLGLLSYISLVASTHVMVPIQTQYKALKGTELLLKTVKRVRARANPDLSIAGIVPTMHDSRTVQDQMSLEAIYSQLAQVAPVFSPIPRSVAFADASQEHLPLALYSAKHPAVAMLQKIAEGMEQIK
ncbi:MAG TPA: ParA family protein [Leptolyngbyaceae cyanobacterium]